MFTLASISYLHIDIRSRYKHSGVVQLIEIRVIKVADINFRKNSDVIWCQA